MKHETQCFIIVVFLGLKSEMYVCSNENDVKDKKAK